MTLLFSRAGYPASCAGGRQRLLPLLRFVALNRVPNQICRTTRKMATVNDDSSNSIPHTVRTANDPRQTGLYNATLSRIEQVNSKIRLLRLSLPREQPPLRHLPGQWLDVHIPSLTQAGGFTITSPPFTSIPTTTTTSTPFSASPSSLESESESEVEPYVELAIQHSPHNPAAAFFWRSPVQALLGTRLQIRVGGRFVYPPPTLSIDECRAIDRAVFVAGGVGINPIMSMVSAMHSLGAGKLGGMIKRVRVMYAAKSVRRDRGEASEAEEILFLERLSAIARTWHSRGCGQEPAVDFQLSFFETGATEIESKSEKSDSEKTNKNKTFSPADELLSSSSSTFVGRRPPPPPTLLRYGNRRITHSDLLDALGPEDERANTVAYVCGPPKMTDEFVDVLQSALGMEEKRVLCEKWW